MRVLLLNYEYPPLGGGAGNATRCILEEYAGMPGLDVDLVTSSPDGDFHVDSVGGSVRVHRLFIGKDSGRMRAQSFPDLLRYSWKSLWYCRRLCRKGRYDVIHAFFGVPCGFEAMLLSRLFAIPYIVSLRGADVPGYTERFKFLYGFLRPLITMVWKKAARVVSVSNGLRELAHKSDPARPIDIIHNGVDTELFRPKEDAGREQEKNVTILCASRLTRRKGFDLVIEAFDTITNRYPDARLVIAGGEGNAEKELKGLVSKKKLESKVSFFGEYDRKSLIKLQEESDIFVFPSWNEGMSNSMLEAMASGLPVVMTPTGGAEEVIREGENGYLVKFGDVADIAQKMEMLIRDSDLRVRMGRESRATAERMNWASAAANYARLYRTVADNGKTPLSDSESTSHQ